MYKTILPIKTIKSYKVEDLSIS